VADQIRYSSSDVARLAEGFVETAAGEFVDVCEVSWITMRARTETTGNLDSAGWHEVIDLERALDALKACGCRGGASTGQVVCRCKRKEAALVFMAAMHMWKPEEMQMAFAHSRTPFGRLQAKAQAFIGAFLNGESPAIRDLAFKRGRYPL
jgi:hypothetical protein